MPLKLLNFPYVILFELLRMTDFRDIFTLSANAIQYKADGDKLSVFTFNIFDKYEHMLILKTNPFFDERKKTEKLRIGENNFSCTWNNYTIECLLVYPNIIQMTISNHICGLLKYLPDIDLKLSSSSVALKLYPEIKNVTDSCLGNVLIDTETIEQFISLYPNQKSVTIEGRIEGQLQINSTIHQIENLCLHKSRLTASTVLENFTGRCLRLYESKMEIPTGRIIHRLINQWITGKSYTNLDFLFIELREVSEVHSFDEPAMLREFETITKQWDRSRRPEHFIYSQRIFESKRQRLTTVECDDLLDVQRQTDEVWASFGCNASQFLFVVWN